MKFTGGFRVSFANGVLVGNCNELSESQTPHFPGNQYPEIPSASNTLQLATIPPIHGVFVAGRTTTAQVRQQSNEKTLGNLVIKGYFRGRPSHQSVRPPPRAKTRLIKKGKTFSRPTQYHSFTSKGWTGGSIDLRGKKILHQSLRM